ncbi:MAG: hypothetical protein ACFFDI_26105 [Promethearchaeota archaeon]
MAKISAYLISCSSDAGLDTRKLYIWGQIGKISWLPESYAEAKKRVMMCQEQNKCAVCDYEIHKVTRDRTKRTYLQLSRYTSGDALELSKCTTEDILEGKDYEQIPPRA